VVDGPDYWECPDVAKTKVPDMVIYTPLLDVAPTSYTHGQRFCNDLAAVGLQSSGEGDSGLRNLGFDFNGYLNGYVYGGAGVQGGRFDAFMVFYSLGRIPDQLYSLMHSEQDTSVLGQYGRRNAVGIRDMGVNGIDDLTETVKYSLDPDDIEVAAKEVQRRLYDTSYSYALAYMLLYSRSYFNAVMPGLEGVVKSPGYGSDNGWTYLSTYWNTTSPNKRYEDHDHNATTPDRSVLVYVNGDFPDSFNYCFATTVYEWNIIGQTGDGLSAVNPYNHNDIPWIATDWVIKAVPAGMDISVELRTDVKWQDGHKVNASDIEWCLEFLRDRNVPRYAETMGTLIDVEIVSEFNCTIHSDEEGLSLFYDYMGLGVLLPRQIWDRAWADDTAVLNYDPREAYSVATGYTAGPTPTPTNIMGTGPWIFQFYDTANGYDDMYANENYFMSQADVAALMTSMFWEVGDEDSGGLVNISDLTKVSFAYGAGPSSDRWNGNANFVKALDPIDEIIDMRDLRTSSYHLTWQKFWRA
jgi:ABC-type transport system substrate-binding protein